MDRYLDMCELCFRDLYRLALLTTGNPDAASSLVEHLEAAEILAEAGIESFIVGSSGLFNNDPDLVKAFDIMMDDFNKAVNG